MKSMHLILVFFCHLLVASVVFYSAAFATPVHIKPVNNQQKPVNEELNKIFEAQKGAPVVAAAAAVPTPVVVSTGSKVDQLIAPNVAKVAPMKHVQLDTLRQAAPAPSFELAKRSDHLVESKQEQIVKPPAIGVLEAAPAAHVKPIGVQYAPASELSAKAAAPQGENTSQLAKNGAKIELESTNEAKVVNNQAIAAKSDEPVLRSEKVSPAPVVMGGLGPLNLLATTLCSYQPDKPTAEESLNQLYQRRSALRKSLFDFMSLKFTNLEKLSSRLGVGLQVVPVKSTHTLSGADVAAANGATQPPSHGWPVVGKCTAHDLGLMGEAASLSDDVVDSNEHCNSKGELCNYKLDTDCKPCCRKAKIGGKSDVDAPKNSEEYARGARTGGARSIQTKAFLLSPEQSSVISKLIHVGDTKDAPVVESTIKQLNLTEQQLASLEAQATSTVQCRRNALKYTKALFNHLAEDQKSPSDSWPKLYALISADDCARKRMIDIVTALSQFRSEATSIRRDNLEFAFAMDDLRAKVLESEVNVPLTFDKQFIEVEQFLQQSVRLMLSNIDPSHTKFASMRFKSLVFGSRAFDDSCNSEADLHQKLLTQSYPTDCNPIQFGQLPDVLRMTASSLELWSIEKELSLRAAKVPDYPNSNAVGQQKVKENVNECIANLVAG